MDDDQLLRYSRQIMLPGLDYEGQQRLLDASVLIVGLGGLGSPAALYLAAAGVGRLVLADFDRVALTNLQRQILYRSEDVGALKAEVARERLNALNPDVRVETVTDPLDDASLPDLVAGVDAVADGCDNFATRFAVNRACVAGGRPLVSAAVIRMEAQIAVYRSDRPGAPCYRCVFPETGEAAETCSETGVLGPLTGVVGSLQAVETVKLLAGLGEGLESRLLTLDAMRMRWRTLSLVRDPDCPVCGGASG
ncbi:Molybdopterin-synthase adenylyltransferase [wastewater metagenome]|uniref:Molybdopterin-synthase adenylyltransferase n=2 Tax=unclassified sequences TaxID=12908 RepID=A0A5B8R5R6_9ZZZZ|nr:MULTISPECIES: molybdopterin-synthase adenylyltransferase MoeB [Arhodomonas]MCS4504101.1 molybdopterin-synthase adenylyltransferase MoeB [Arhodomonas aquaeolei]QEA03900.1 molybdopterin-synthase adenylyltransferase [uncultured organism]